VIFVNIDDFCVNIYDVLYLFKIFAFQNVVSVPRKSFKFFLPRSWLAKIRHTDISRKTLIHCCFFPQCEMALFSFHISILLPVRGDKREDLHRHNWTLASLASGLHGAVSLLLFLSVQHLKATAWPLWKWNPTGLTLVYK